MRSRIIILWREIYARLTQKGSFGHSASLVAGGTALAQVGGLLVAPFLTRLYAVSDFGNLQIFVSMLSFGFSVVAGRYELAVLLPKDEGDAANVVVLGLGMVVLTSLGYAGILWGLVGLHLLPVSWEAVQAYFWLVPVSMCGAGAYLVLNHWVIRHREYKQVALTKLTQAAGQLGCQLLLGILKAGLIGLIVGDALGRCSGSLRLAKLAWTCDKKQFQSVTWRNVKEVAVRYRAFPLLSTISGFLNTLGLGLPILLIGIFYDTTVLGWFSLVDRLLNVPCAVVGQALAQVYLGEAPKLLQHSRDDLRLLFLRRAWQLALMGLLPFVLLWVIAPGLFAFLFGPTWREAGYYARILIPMNYIAFVIWPLMSTLNLLERQNWQLVWDIGRLILTVGGMAAAHYLGNYGARSAIAVYSGAMFTGYITYFMLSLFAMGHYGSRSGNVTAQ